MTKVESKYSHFLSPAQAGDGAFSPEPSCCCPRIRSSLPASASPSCPSLDGCMLLCYQLYATCDEGQECSEVVQYERQCGFPGQNHSLRAYRADTSCPVLQAGIRDPGVGGTGPPEASPGRADGVSSPRPHTVVPL